MTAPRSNFKRPAINTWAEDRRIARQMAVYTKSLNRFTEAMREASQAVAAGYRTPAQPFPFPSDRRSLVDGRIS